MNVLSLNKIICWWVWVLFSPCARCAIQLASGPGECFHSLALCFCIRFQLNRCIITGLVLSTQLLELFFQFFDVGFGSYQMVLDLADLSLIMLLFWEPLWLFFCYYFFGPDYCCFSGGGRCLFDFCLDGLDSIFCLHVFGLIFFIKFLIFEESSFSIFVGGVRDSGSAHGSALFGL